MHDSTLFLPTFWILPAIYGFLHSCTFYYATIYSSIYYTFSPSLNFSAVFSPLSAPLCCCRSFTTWIHWFTLRCLYAVRAYRGLLDAAPPHCFSHLPPLLPLLRIAVSFFLVICILCVHPTVFCGSCRSVPACRTVPYLYCILLGFTLPAQFSHILLPSHSPGWILLLSLSSAGLLYRLPAAHARRAIPLSWFCGRLKTVTWMPY